MGQDHAFFIWAAYGATFLIVLALALRIAVTYGARKRTLARLEAEAGPTVQPAGERPRG